MTTPAPTSQSELLFQPSLFRPVKAVVLALLKSGRQPSAWELSSEVETKLGLQAYWDLEVGSDEQLLSALQHTPGASWNDKTAALIARFQNAARKAAKLLEPKTQYVTLKSGTLQTDAEASTWLAELKKGPVVVG